MASSINASTSGAGGVITSADNSGILNLQSGGNTIATVQSTGFSLPASATISAANTFGFENRIINGGMVIDQRNAGASVTPTNGSYTLDRWFFSVSQTSKLTCQQNAGSVTPPTGFTKYLGVTSSSAYSVGASELFVVRQNIEGFNVADLDWGTANAKTVTLSFWVRSSLTGTFGGTFRNSAGNRFYPYSYTISAANTWEQKSVTIAGDTSGTWATDNTSGIELFFSLGSGSTVSGTAGAWGSTVFYSATGAVSVVGTSGATFYITGVQLEVGSQATSFDFRDYTTELGLCQRYFSKSYNIETVPNTNTGVGAAGGITQGTDRTTITNFFKVQMRTSPTVQVISTSGSNGFLSTTAGANAGSSCAFALIGSSCISEAFSGGTALTSLTIFRCHYTASAEL